jgi:hypothetical protein
MQEAQQCNADCRPPCVLLLNIVIWQGIAARKEKEEKD